ncbi:NAD(+) diphosphatase [Sandaracinobacteroides saxicola]|uniref:NAD(+) diphosphatase n=1 Tax=Sandaracinobacteroides saxicola TaxID=2759707 RepID=UPI001FB0E752|nr:NAD(+) diphosphatase [Sandaracinobacteroides saxicola]
MTVMMGFTGSPLDRADHIRRDAEAVAVARMHPAARWLVLDELRPVIDVSRAGFDLFWARRSEIPDGPGVFLGLDADGAPRFAVSGPAKEIIEDFDAELVDARAVAMRLADGRAAIVAQARSLLDWHARHRFCANCGAETKPAKAGYSRECGGCGAEHFPRTDPVAIMLALREDLALVGRQPRFPKGFFSALAGFVEPGESLEEAVMRELHEEAGIRTSNVRYVGSQPWPFPSSLMIGAFADADGFELAIDGEEIEEARWVSRAEVAAALAGTGSWMAPPPMAIAHHLLAAWVAEGLPTRAAND